MATPGWALFLAFWLHMLATVIWIGGLATLALLILPVAHRTLQPPEYAQMLMGVNKRLSTLGWISLTVLIATGLIQMSANPNYEGFLSISNTWARAILFKHIVFFAMILVSSYQTWGLSPAIERAAWRRAHGLESNANEQEFQHREANLVRVNLLLGAIVLALTALARIA